MTVRNTIIIFILMITTSCNSENNDLTDRRTFTHNCVLMYYKYIDLNPEKYKAAQFLIDNAFKVWKESKQAKNLSFEEFKEYILPYRSIKGYGFLDTGKRYNKLFCKYILSDSQANTRNRVEYYNTAINVCYRNLFGATLPLQCVQ